MRADLEAYKSLLEIAVGLGSTLSITSIQETTDATRRDVAFIKQDMAQVTRLVAGTRALRMQFHQLDEQGVGISIPLQRFPDETESYARSVRSPDDIFEVVWEGRTAAADSRHVAETFDPLAGGDCNDILRSEVTIRHLSGKFASFVQVVPLLQADADSCLAHQTL